MGCLVDQLVLPLLDGKPNRLEINVDVGECQCLLILKQKLTKKPGKAELAILSLIKRTRDTLCALADCSAETRPHFK